MKVECDAYIRFMCTIPSVIKLSRSPCYNTGALLVPWIYYLLDTSTNYCSLYVRLRQITEIMISHPVKSCTCMCCHIAPLAHKAVNTCIHVRS